jgi:gliding motility-associated-like protein
MNGYGCADSADIAVTVYPQAIAQINAAPLGGCSPVTVNFQSASANASSILWNFGDGQTSSASTVAHTFVNTTNAVVTYQVQLIANAIGGCNDTTYVQIPVYPALDLQMPITSAQGCSPFIFQSPTFTGVQSFNWNFGDGTSSNLPFPTHIYTNNSAAIQNYTIHFIGTNGYGCADSADIAVTVYPQAIAQIQMNPNSGCSPLVVDLTNTSINATSVQWSFSNGGTSTANTLSHTFVNPTNSTQIFTVELVANGLGGCSDTTQLQVPVYPALDMIVPVTSVQGCSPLTFVAPQISGVQSFSWNFGDGITSNLPYPIHVFTNATNAVENFTIHLIGTSSYGCTDSVNIPVSVLPQAVASIVADPTIGCSPLAVNFVSNSQNATSLNWDFGDGSTSTASVVSHVFANTTSLIQLNTVTLIANNSYGCADTTGIQIPVYPELNLVANNDPQNGCSPYTFLVPSMAGVQTYFWDFGDGFTSNIPYPVHSFSNTSNQVQTHVVHFVGTSGFGCSDSLDFVVSVQPEVTADIQANVTNGCGPLEVTFTNNSVNASGYTWSYGNGGSSNTNLITHNVVYSNGTTVPQVFQVSLLANQVNGCTDVDTLTITVYPNSAAGFNFAGIGCSPLTVNFNNTSSFGTTAQWNFGDGTTSQAGYPTHTFYANGFNDTSYNISLIATNSYGCADTIQHPVTVLYSPIAAGGVTSLSGCYPLNVVLSNTSQGATSYLWNYGNGITSTTDAASHEYAYFNLSNQTQTYQITLTATASNGCSSVIDTSVNVLPQITADADVYVSGCNPVSAVFNNQSVGATGYFWIFGNGNTSTNANENQLFYNNGNEDTTYVVTLTTTNSFNCSVSHEYLILVHPLPEALFTATPELQTWPENEVTIVNSSFGTNLGYHWSFGDGTQAFVSSPGTHTFPTWGTFNIELIVNQGLCTDTLVKPISIVPPAAEAIFSAQAEGCAPVVITLQNASNFAASYLWIFGDGGTSSASNPTYTYWTPGTYSITLIAYGYDGGSDTLVLSNVIVVYPNATAAFTVTPNEVSIPSQPVYLLNASTVATTYQWSFGDGETSTTANPIHYYQAEGNYNIQLIANNQYNCPDTLTYYSIVHAVGDGLLDYPNAFTPNHLGQGDGIYDPIGYSNDIFCPLHKGVTSYQLQIFNKWGELLFETDNVHVGWDGYYRGQLCKEDVYVWKARATFANGTSVTKAGDVTLLAR